MKQATHQSPIPPRFLQPVEAAERKAARLDELLQQLRSKKGCVDQEALEELRALGPAAVPGLIAAVDLKRRHRWKIGKTIDTVVDVFALLTALTYIAIYLLTHPFQGVDMLAYPLYGLMKSLLLSVLFPRPIDGPIVQTLVEIGDVRAVGVFTRLLHWKFKDGTNKKIRASLTDLLPRLAYADRHLLDEKDRGILRRLLKAATNRYVRSPNRGAEFNIAIVKTLVQIRDTDSLPILRRVAHHAVDPGVRRMAALGVTELEGRIASGEAVHP